MANTQHDLIARSPAIQAFSSHQAAESIPLDLAAT